MTKIMTATEITDGQIEIIAVGLKQTKDCFTYKMRYGYHDPNLDLWLPLEQKARASGKATVWQLLEKLTFIEMAQNLLKTSETDIKKLSKLLIEGNHTFTLLEIEALIKRQEEGEEIGMLIRHVSFFFVEDVDGKVSVVCVYWVTKRWDVSVYSLLNSHRWGEGYRFFSRK